MKSFFWGALGGGSAAFVVWFLANRAIDAQLRGGAAGLEPQVRAAVEESVPPAVRAELTQTLNRYTLTPHTGQLLNDTLTPAHSAGII